MAHYQFPTEPVDLVVIGGGPIGLSTAHEAAKAGKKVVLLEKSIFFNQSGSSGDLVRMFRTAYTEKFMADLAYQSMSVWDDLEKEAGKKLRLMTGLLNFGDPKYGEGGPEGTLLGPIPNLKCHNMEFKELTKDQIEEQYPFRNLPNEWIGLDMKDNGCIDVSSLCRTLYDLATKHEAILKQYADVKAIMPIPNQATGWIVEGMMSDPEENPLAPFSLRTDKIAITSGAWINHVLKPSFHFELDINIWEMVYAYYAVDTQVPIPKMWFQFQEDKKEGIPSHRDAPAARSNLFYGFPPVPWGVPNVSRIAVDAATNIITDPDQRRYADISSDDLANTRDWVIKHVNGVGPNPVPIFAGACLQTNVFDNMFVLDYIPDDLLGHSAGSERSKSIAVFTAGWAMKFVPLIGKILEKMLFEGNTTPYDISQFKMERDGKKIIKKQQETAVSHHIAGSSRHGKRVP